LETCGIPVENLGNCYFGLWQGMILCNARLQNLHFISSTWIPWYKSQEAQGFGKCSREKAIVL